MKFQREQTVQTVTKAELQSLIAFYNSYADDYNKLGIGKMPLIDEECPITVEELFFFQGILASNMTKFIKNNMKTKGGQK